VEDLANRVIFENRLVHIHFIESEKQTQLPLRTQSARQGWLRIIEIADFDWSPCGGTHCRQTGEVGLIKVRRWEKSKKRVRVEFYCGWRALRDYRWKNRVLYELSRLYSSNEHGVAKAAERNHSRQQDLRKRLARMEDTLLAAKAERFLRQSTARNGIQVVCDILEEEESQNAKELARRIVEGDSKRVVLLGIRGERPSLLFTCSDDFSHDMRDWIRMVAPFIQGRGGGNAKQAQAGGCREEGLEQALNKAQELL
jgi:alanyl-tRNA synthetase